MNLNKVQLIGRVTRDPEVKSTANGTSVVKLGIATNHVWKDASGQKKESTQFHNIVAWGKLAETIGKYVTKGQELYVEGRLEYREWEKQDGGKGYMTEIILDSFQFGAKPKSEHAGAAKAAAAKGVASMESEIKVEDIPF